VRPFRCWYQRHAAERLNEVAAQQLKLQSHQPTPDARTVQGEAISVDPSQIHQLLSADQLRWGRIWQSKIQGIDLRTLLV